MENSIDETTQKGKSYEILADASADGNYACCSYENRLLILRVDCA